MQNKKTFWPVSEGDNKCPVCGTELVVSAIYVSEGGNPFMYDVTCPKCEAVYIIRENIRVGMKIEFAEIKGV